MEQSQTLPPMTALEAQDLVAAIAKWFGPCMCGQPAVIDHHMVQIERCAGHSWLVEPHRLSRLLWIRRTYPQWADREFGPRTPAQMLQDAIAAQVAEIIDDGI